MTPRFSRHVGAAARGLLALCFASLPLCAQTSLTFTDGQTDSTAYDTSNSPLTLTIDSGSATQSGVLSGSGSVVKAGAGTLILSGANTYKGNTTISGGVLQLSGDGTLGFAQVYETGLYLTDGAGLDLGGTTQHVTSVGSASQGLVGNISNGTLDTLYDVYLQSGVFTNTFVTTLVGSWTYGRLWIGGDSSATVYLNGTNDALYIPDNNAVIIGYTSVTGAAGTVKVGNANALAASSQNVQVWSGTLDLNGQTGVRANSIQLSSGSSSLLLNSDAASAASFAGGVTLATGSAHVGGAGDLTLSGELNGSGGLTKIGAGTLTLAHGNSYAGGTTIEAGTLTLGDALALQNSTLTYDNQGGALSFGTLSSATFGGLAGAQSLALANASSDAVALTVGGNNASTAYSGLFSGAGSLTKSGSGTLTLSGANTYTGGTTISAGTLAMGSASALSSGAVAINSGATLNAASYGFDFTRLSGSGTLTGSGANVFNSSATTSLATVLAGSASLTKSGSGSLTLTGANTYTGATTISAGTLTFGPGAVPNATSVSVSNGAAFVTSGAASIKYLTGAGSATLGGMLTLTGFGSSTFSGSLSGGTVYLSTGSNAAYLTLSGSTDTNTGLSVYSPGGYILLTGGANYSGNVQISGGSSLGVFNATLSGNSVQVLSGATLTIGNGGTTGQLAAANVSNGGSLTVNRSSDLTVSSYISSSGTFTKSGAGTLTLTNNNGQFTGMTISGGALQLGNGGTSGALAGNIANHSALIFNRSNDLTHSNVISGSGSVTKLGAGILTLSGSNTYTGATTISAGTLKLSSASALANTTAVTVASGATFDLNNLTKTIGSLAGAGTVSLGSGTLTSSSSSSTTFAGALTGTGGFTKTGSGTLTLSGDNTHSGATTISDGTLTLGAGGTSGALGSGNIVNNASLVVDRADALTLANAISGSGTLTKQGAGVVTLSGANTYTGATAISAGTLLVNGSLANTAVTVASGATLGGSGSIGGITTISSGGTLAAGNSPGLLTISNNLVLADDSFTVMELGGLDRGTGYDALDVTGSLTFGGTLEVTLYNGFTVVGGESFDLFNWGSTSGTFALLDLPTLATGLSWDTSALYTSGILSVSGSAIPEPSTYAAIFGVAALGLVLARRRKHRV